MIPDDPRHGTESGVWMHRATKTPTCEACRAWKATYERGRLNDAIMGRPRLIPVIGSVRRLCALQRLGWTMGTIAQRGGWKNRDSLLWMVRQSRLVTRSNAERIDRIYRELCMTVGPSEITRSRAERAGYAPPLAWTNIDDPDETPDLGGRDDEIDPVVISRVLAGDVVVATRAERTEIFRRWVAMGRPLRELEARTGWEPSRYYRIGDVA